MPLITEAAVGSTLCKLLLLEGRTTYCLTLFIASYLCGGIGMLLAAAVIVLYLQRLILHHLPPREVVVSSWVRRSVPFPLPSPPSGSRLTQTLRARSSRSARSVRAASP